MSLSTSLRELPAEERPRERLAKFGAESLSDPELLAIFVRTGTSGRDAICVARELLNRAGGLSLLSRLGPQEIPHLASGIGPAKAAELTAAFEIGKRLARNQEERPQLSSSRKVFEVLGPALQCLHQEVLHVGLLDTRLRLIRALEVSRGSLNESIAHPREIFRPALTHSAYGILVLHNHPSGDPTPSESDRRMTRKLLEASHILDIRLTDHLIVGNAEGGRSPYFSFKEAGLL